MPAGRRRGARAVPAPQPDPHGPVLHRLPRRDGEGGPGLPRAARPDDRVRRAGAGDGPGGAAGRLREGVRAMIAAPIDRADIQGDILRAYGNRYDRTSHVFVGVGDPAAGRAWLTGLVEDVTTAVEWRGRRPESTLNVAFTRTGLEALGVAPGVVESFPTEFKAGMAGRKHHLGDV